MSDFKWYAIHTQVGYEDKVKVMLQNKLKEEGLEGEVEEIFVPFEEVIEIKKNNKKEKVKKCLYPSYVFVKARMSDKLYNLVKRMSFVSGFVGYKNEPLPMDEKEIRDIMQRVESSKEAPRLSVSFEPGEQVRVLDGPFANFTGTIDEVDVDKGRLRILISIFGRSTPVELNYNQVEKVE
ncbi:transcription termination/antitermination protein NusG [Hippea maritima]|uniref:Transcription termination/antitermination protein NusG n=1 Tax=Hippea maritima (strain ATCC 700847 / DSM 10411 / MH2) TaxID=760142 RepID=F2LXV4_HIPMA|nr:transcription termination/antitermination protein NusG [Hippea maritima]AEA34345.1 NusG antitermination factor [Hippea maritima DSM 10411]